MTGKHENLYWYALHWGFVASNWKLDPFSVTCNFEKGLHNAIRGQFVGSILNGCLFHWKQEIRRKMIFLKINAKQIKLAMSKNVLDILTILPQDEILSKGIFYVRDIIDTECKDVEDVKKWDFFWNNYFKKYWVSSEEFIKTWNIYNA